MKPKIVKFKNGQYGIRQWTLTGYRYLDLGLKRPNDSEERWWGAIKEYVAKYAAGSEQQARRRLAKYLAPDPDMSGVPGYDKGRPA